MSPIAFAGSVASSVRVAAVLALGALLAACQGGPRLDTCLQAVSVADRNNSLSIDSDAGALSICQIDPARLSARVYLAGSEPLSLVQAGQAAARDADGAFELRLAEATLALPVERLTGISTRLELVLPVTLRDGGGTSVDTSLRLGFNRAQVLAFFGRVARGEKVATTGVGRALVLVDQHAPTIIGAAKTLAELRYVVVRTVREEPVRTCGPYTTPEGHNFLVKSAAHSSEIAVYDTQTGTEVGRHWFEQRLADAPCPETAGTSIGNVKEGNDETRTSETSSAEIQSWLEQWASSR